MIIDILNSFGLSYILLIYAVCTRYYIPYMNGFVGYRSKRSMESEEDWEFAQMKLSKYLLLTNIIIISTAFISRLFIDNFLIYKKMCSFIEMFNLVLAIVYVEYQLKTKKHEKD